MKFVHLFVYFFLLNSLFLYSEEGKKVLAILDIEAKSEVKEEIAGFVTERIRVEMFKLGKYKIVERQKMNKVLEEQKLSLITSDDENYIKRVGNLLSADEILVGSLSYLEKMYYLNVRIIEVKNGEMVFGDTEKASSISDLSEAAENIALKIADSYKVAENVKQEISNSITDDDFEMRDLLRMVKSVVQYSLRKAEELRKNALNDETQLDEKKEENKKEEKMEENSTEVSKPEDRFAKFGGGPLLKYYFDIAFSSRNNTWVHLASPFLYGIKGLVGFGNLFGVGLAGCLGGSFEEIGDKKYVFGVGYGGITFDLYYRLWNFLRLDFNMLLGWGGANFFVFHSDNYETPIFENRTDFFVFEPGVMIGINFFNAFEIGITGSYLYISHNKEFFKPNEYNVGVFIIFGL